MKYATLILASFAFRERYLLRRNKLRKFLKLKFGDKRFDFRYAQSQPAQNPPLDHEGVASTLLYFWQNRQYSEIKYKA